MHGKLCPACLLARGCLSCIKQDVCLSICCCVSPALLGPYRCWLPANPFRPPYSPPACSPVVICPAPVDKTFERILRDLWEAGCDEDDDPDGGFRWGSEAREGGTGERGREQEGSCRGEMDAGG